MKFFYLILIAYLSPLVAASRDHYNGEILTENLKHESLSPLGNRCRLILLRHGETDWNVQNKSQGWTDIPLNDEGRRQAKDLSEKLSELPVHFFYASALSRATETAEILAEPHQGSVVVADKALRFFRQDKIRIFDFLKSKKRKREEIAREVTEDATVYFKDLCRKHPGQTVVVVTHARVVKYLFLSLTNHKRSKVNIKNRAIIRVVGDGETLSLEV